MSCEKIRETFYYKLPKEFGGAATADYVEGRGYTVMFLDPARITRENLAPEKALAARDFIEKGKHGAAFAILNPIFQ